MRTKNQQKYSEIFVFLNNFLIVKSSLQPQKQTTIAILNLHLIDHLLDYFRKKTYSHLFISELYYLWYIHLHQQTLNSMKGKHYEKFQIILFYFLIMKRLHRDSLAIIGKVAKPTQPLLIIERLHLTNEEGLFLRFDFKWEQLVFLKYSLDFSTLDLIKPAL